MANAATAEDHVTLNLGEGGAVIATDFVDTVNMGYGDSTAGPAHFQVVKLSTGDVGEHSIMSKTAPYLQQYQQLAILDTSPTDLLPFVVTLWVIRQSRSVSLVLR